ncbi:hypothetical protein PT277_02555 [Acetobacteraceae bacterium ESL0709]|nr:hypothetical protein [Acetobacteraceae bacterium ESL0697]MDF7677583.1 hypothetical protein [Acetobacteraceae bacterium ESL0709]
MKNLSSRMGIGFFITMLALAGTSIPAPSLMAKTLSPHQKHTSPAVALKPMPGSPEEQAARSLNQDIIDDSLRHHDNPLFLIGSAALSPRKGTEGLFVQIQSPRLCGSSGCTTSVYLRKGKEWVNVLDAVNGDISVLSTRHKGMYDLMVDKSDKWIWNGHAYQDTLPE